MGSICKSALHVQQIESQDFEDIIHSEPRKNRVYTTTSFLEQKQPFTITMGSLPTQCIFDQSTHVSRSPLTALSLIHLQHLNYSILSDAFGSDHGEFCADIEDNIEKLLKSKKTSNKKKNLIRSKRSTKYKKPLKISLKRKFLDPYDEQNYQSENNNDLELEVSNLRSAIDLRFLAETLISVQKYKQQFK